MKQEVLMEAHCTCHHCGREWVVTKEQQSFMDYECCGSTNIKEVPGQLLFSDEDGAWVRRKVSSGPQ